MRVLNGFRWVAVLLITISGITSADLILDNQRVITDITGISISPTSGDLFITTAANNYVVTQDGTPTQAGTVNILTFSANSNVIENGDTITVSWNTVNADGCSATGGFGGWSGSTISLPSGSKMVTANATGNFSFFLSCTGVGGPIASNFTVNVQSGAVEPPVVTECGTVPLSGNYTPWASLWKTDFPNPGYDTENLYIPRRGYQALRFNTGDVVDHGGVISIANTFTNGRRLGAISECMGNFNVAPECTHTWGSRGGVGWSTDGEPGYCQLQPNTDYYINFTFTDGTDPNSSECDINESCIATIQHINY